MQNIRQALDEAKRGLISPTRHLQYLKSWKAGANDPQRKQEIAEAAQLVDNAKADVNRLERELDETMAKFDEAKRRMKNLG